VFALTSLVCSHQYSFSSRTACPTLIFAFAGRFDSRVESRKKLLRACSHPAESSSSSLARELLRLSFSSADPRTLDPQQPVELGRRITQSRNDHFSKLLTYPTRIVSDSTYISFDTVVKRELTMSSYSQIWEDSCSSGNSTNRSKIQPHSFPRLSCLPHLRLRLTSRTSLTSKTKTMRLGQIPP